MKKIWNIEPIIESTASIRILKDYANKLKVESDGVFSAEVVLSELNDIKTTLELNVKYGHHKHTILYLFIFNNNTSEVALSFNLWDEDRNYKYFNLPDEKFKESIEKYLSSEAVGNFLNFLYETTTYFAQTE
jgi:hypothetical protein